MTRGEPVYVRAAPPGTLPFCAAESGYVMKPYERNIVPKQIDTTTKPIEAEIVRLLDEMAGLSAESIEYKAHLDAVLRLTESLPKKEGKKLSPDAILGAATNLIGIGAVLHHEKLNVITSKAFGWIRRS